jgi:hypothetical protein
MSGSPVSWLLPMPKVNQYPEINAAMRGLLGLVSAHETIYEELRKRSGEITDDAELRKLITRLNSGIAYVTPADAIHALLMTTVFVDERDRSLSACLGRNPRKRG